MSFCISIVYISTKSMERSTTLFEVFATSDFSATNTTTDRHFYTFGTSTHCRRNGILDSAAILDTAFNLLGNILGNQNSIHLRTLNLADVYLDIFTRKFLKLFLQLVNLRTCTADNKTRTSSIDCNSQKLQCTLDVNLGYTSFCKACIEILTDFVILNQFLFKSSSTKPVGVPSTDDT